MTDDQRTIDTRTEAVKAFIANRDVFYQTKLARAEEMLEAIAAERDAAERRVAELEESCRELIDLLPDGEVKAHHQATLAAQPQNPSPLEK